MNGLQFNNLTLTFDLFLYAGANIFDSFQLN